MTVLSPSKRLAQHNRNFDEAAGKIVKAFGQQWELKTYVAVPNPYWAESVFWGATGLAEIPYRSGLEVATMDWPSLQAGLDAAKMAGPRPPKPVPDWVHAYSTWMHRQLEGRGITLVGHVRSKFGKSDFRCTNGHQWRATPIHVAEGEGCAECGIGRRSPEDVIGPSTLCLLVHPSEPGLIKICLTSKRQELWRQEDVWCGWEVHRYRQVDDPRLAESLIWDLLGHPLPRTGDPIRLDLRVAEQAFRDLIPRMQHELALSEKLRIERSAR